jgi:hypothetical protein
MLEVPIDVTLNRITDGIFFSFLAREKKMQAAQAAARRQLLSYYRTILKLHQRKLPDEMRQLGDQYVKSEFRSIRNAKKEIQVTKCVAGSLSSEWLPNQIGTCAGSLSSGKCISTH